jgi:hypothetical protein
MQRSIFILLLLSFTSTLAFAAPQIPSFTATYTLSKGNITIGNLRRSLAPAEDGNLKFESAMHVTGFVAVFVKDELSESSLWSYRNEQVRPQTYTYSKTGGKKNSQLKFDFDWKNNLVKNTVVGEEWEMSLPPGAQDKISYQLAIMHDLERGKTEFEYPIADKKKFKTYRFKVVVKETLDTPLGTLETIKVERIMASDKKTTVLWCAPGLHYLPVRIEQNEKDGGEFSLLIQSVEGLRPM